MPEPIVASLQGAAVIVGLTLAFIAARLADHPPRRRH